MILQGLGLALLAAVAAAGLQTWRLEAAQDELAAERAAVVKVALLHAENARKVEGNWNRKVRNAQQAREAERADSARAADLLRGDADGVRDDVAAFAAGGADDSIAACRDRAATLGQLLDRALQADRRSTESAEAHAADVRSLRSAWPSGVTE